MVPQLRTSLLFPDPSTASESGVLAYGGDLSPSRLLLAYRNGIFPWYSVNDPILWWSPNPRLIMNLDDFKLRRSLRKKLNRFEIRFDTAFEEVITRCGSKFRENQKGSWIMPEIVEAYTTLHHMGHAHSVEAFYEGELVGGLYGICVGKVFCGESMFADMSDASKVAFAYLIEHLKEKNYDFIDAQIPTEHLKSLGAIEVHRDYFLNRLREATKDIEVVSSW
ncbi:MAG: leucyl/phenylalanyl-tRNA--protein transferase [Campylobacterota bacterium]|nr:leucyl/phenylalanyl-tRNA--protein transferase [Campylobacterota bacterium]